MASLTADLLTEITGFIRRFVVMDEDEALAMALWVMHTHTFEAADVTPTLSIKSAEKRSGKTLLLELLSYIVARPWLTSRVTPGVLVRKIAVTPPPTLLLDEADAAFNGPREYAEALRGLLNAGYRRDGVTSLLVRKGGDWLARDFPVFAPRAIAGIGKLPDTVADRSIPINLRRRTAQETRERFHPREVRPVGTQLRDEIICWADQFRDLLPSARPAIPPELDDRAAEIWEPLLAIADLDDGDLPAQARAAALSLSTGDDRQDDSLAVKLLSDIRAIFLKDKALDRRTSKGLVDDLVKLVEAPWGDLRGQPINERTLAHMFRPYGIKSHQIRVGATTLKGYMRSDFADAWARYVPDPPTTETTETNQEDDVNYNGDEDSTDETVLYGADNMVVSLRTLVAARNTAKGNVDEPDDEEVATLVTNLGLLSTAQTAVDDAIKVFMALPGITPAASNGVTGTYTVSVDGDADIVGALVGGSIVPQAGGRSTVTGLEAGSYDGMDNVVLVMVQCDSGEFKVTFEGDASSGLSEYETFDCAGDVEGAEIKAAKSAIYLNSDTTSTLITVTIEDEAGSPAVTAEKEVDFSTDYCEFEEASSRTPTMYSADSATDGRGNTVATVTLDCSDADPGVATITAGIDKPGSDIALVTTVKVVGPPAEITADMSSMMDSLTCGEVVNIQIMVSDAAGQPVANGTLVNLTTNVDGVVIAPAITSSGVANAVLITSNTHSPIGQYAVVVQSGSVVVYDTVSCEAAAAPAPVEAPAITPPSTGDAGLAETSGSSWMLLVIAGALVSVMAAVGKGLPSFFRR